MYWRLHKSLEIGLDWHQWILGFNYYPEMGLGLNVFIGPIRITKIRLGVLNFREAVRLNENIL